MCTKKKEREGEREKWTWKGCLFCEVKCFNLWMKCPFLTDRNVKGAYTCQGTGVSVDPRNVPHINFFGLKVIWHVYLTNSGVSH